MNFGLGEEIDALRDTVSRFAADRIAPVAEETDRDNQFPMHLWQEMGALGLLGMTADPISAAPGWAISRMWWRWRRSAAHPPRSACPTARIPTCASTRSTAGATRHRSRNTCPS
jgi:alkylation response protein AidB-like acyl-CoA dehydrogenase